MADTYKKRERHNHIVSVQQAVASPLSFCWSDDTSPTGRAIALVKSMAAAEIKNRYPKGVFGHEARAHYDEARNIVCAMGRAPLAETAQQAQGEARRPGPAKQDAPK